MDRLESDRARMPAIWWFEVRNVLLIGERRGRTAREHTERFFDFLRALPIDIAPFPQELAVLSLARRHQLSFYDASYLELANANVSRWQHWIGLWSEQPRQRALRWLAFDHA